MAEEPLRARDVADAMVQSWLLLQGEALPAPQTPPAAPIRRPGRDGSPSPPPAITACEARPETVAPARIRRQPGAAARRAAHFSPETLLAACDDEVFLTGKEIARRVGRKYNSWLRRDLKELVDAGLLLQKQGTWGYRRVAGICNGQAASARAAGDSGLTSSPATD